MVSILGIGERVVLPPVHPFLSCTHGLVLLVMSAHACLHSSSTSFRWDGPTSVAKLVDKRLPQSLYINHASSICQLPR